MNGRWKIFITALIFLLAVNGSYAGQMKKTAQTAMKWLSIPVGARAISLGTANFCNSGSAGDLFWNPAGTASIESPQLFLSHMQWIADVSLEAAAAAIPIGGTGVVSVSARAVNYGTLMGTQFVDSNAEIFQLTGEFSPSSYQFGVGFAQHVTDRFSYGVHLSYARESLGNAVISEFDQSRADARSEATSMSLLYLDFGVVYYTGFHDLRVGMTLQNFSQDKGYADVNNPIPMDIRMSMAMDMIPVVNELLGMSGSGGFNHKFTLSVDASHPRDYSERMHVGAEYIFQDFIALRTGYKFNYDEESVAFGAGLMKSIAGKKLAIDYAYLPFGIFDSVNTFTFTLNF